MRTAAPLQNSPAKSLLVSKYSHAGLLLHRNCACGRSVSSSLGGECGRGNKPLQTKIRISARNDPLEQEADRVANQVLATPAHAAFNGAAPRIQRRESHPTGQIHDTSASIDHALASPGRPLEPALRQDMEQRFGHDLSRVRVHTGTAAEHSAHNVNAHAYTLGHNIVFGTGQFAPWTNARWRLIAHELTPVVQQSSGADGNRVGKCNESRGLSSISESSAASERKSRACSVADGGGPIAQSRGGRRLAACFRERRAISERLRPGTIGAENCSIDVWRDRS